MIGAHPSDIVRSVCVLVSPLVMMFGFYVIAHGHYVPGGGFAGGVAVAVSIVLLRLVLEPEDVAKKFPPRLGLILGVTGLLLYIAVGVVPLAVGAEFLDYAAVDTGASPADLRYLGILMVEIAVGITVSGALLVIFDVLIGQPRTRLADEEEQS